MLSCVTGFSWHTLFTEQQAGTTVAQTAIVLEPTLSYFDLSLNSTCLQFVFVSFLLLFFLIVGKSLCLQTLLARARKNSKHFSPKCGPLGAPASQWFLHKVMAQLGIFQFQIEASQMCFFLGCTQSTLNLWCVSSPQPRSCLCVSAFLPVRDCNWKVISYSFIGFLTFAIELFYLSFCCIFLSL